VRKQIQKRQAAAKVAGNNARMTNRTHDHGAGRLRTSQCDSARAMQCVVFLSWAGHNPGVRNGVTKQLDLAGHVVINNTVGLTGQHALAVRQRKPVRSHCSAIDHSPWP
jgi:hypothetical protein